MSDYINSTIDVPYGKTPVVLTFDLKVGRIADKVCPDTDFLTGLLTVPMSNIHFKVGSIVIDRCIGKEPASGNFAYPVSGRTGIIKNHGESLSRCNKLGVYTVHKRNG